MEEDYFTNLERKVTKLQRLLARYRELSEEHDLLHSELSQKYGEVLQGTLKAIEKQKELKHSIKEWRYNRDNPDPPEDLGNGMVKITLWKALPKEEPQP
jgi:hypothetical protein